jgi:hypothetical protein
LVKYEALVANGASERLPASEAELASRFGMDTGMLVAIGGWRALLNVLPAKDAQHWEAIVPRAEEPIWASREDPALRSWFRDAYLTHPGTGYQRPKVLGVLDTKPMAICVAGNASGKTTLKWNLPVGSVFDLDEAFRASGYLAVLKQTPNLRTGALPSEVVRFLADACATNGCSFLMSQYPARWMAQVVAAMHRTIEIVYLVHTGVLEMWTRTADTRAWDIDKCARRHDRIVEQFSEWASIANASEIPLQEMPSVPEAWKHYVARVVPPRC